MKKLLSLLALSLLVTSCTSVSDSGDAPGRSKSAPYVKQPIDVSNSPTIVVRISNDSRNFASNIARRLEQAGFKVLPEGSTPDYYADADYDAYWDVVHETFTYFHMALVDAKTGEPRVKLRYGGGTFSSHGCDTALDMVFKKLATNLITAPDKR